jgi:hypothetical protein
MIRAASRAIPTRPSPTSPCPKRLSPQSLWRCYCHAHRDEEDAGREGAREGWWRLLEDQQLASHARKLLEVRTNSLRPMLEDQQLASHAPPAFCRCRTDPAAHLLWRLRSRVCSVRHQVRGGWHLTHMPPRISLSHPPISSVFPSLMCSVLCACMRKHS